MSRELKFASTDAALQHLANVTGRKINIVAKNEGDGILAIYEENLSFNDVLETFRSLAKTNNAFLHFSTIDAEHQAFFIITGVTSKENAAKKIVKFFSSESVDLDAQAEVRNIVQLF